MRYLGVRKRLSPLNMETSKANIHSGLLSGGRKNLKNSDVDEEGDKEDDE